MPIKPGAAECALDGVAWAAWWSHITILPPGVAHFPPPTAPRAQNPRLCAPAAKFFCPIHIYWERGELRLHQMS